MDGNIGPAIQNSQFDYIWTQFYNNPGCSAYQLVRPDGDAGSAFNFNDWATWLAGTASSGAELFVGLPASPMAAQGNSNGAIYYLSGPELQTVVNSVASQAVFGGVMIYDAGNSDSVNIGGCNYAQEISSVLRTGASCGGGSGTPTGPSSTPSPSPQSYRF